MSSNKDASLGHSLNPNSQVNSNKITSTFPAWFGFCNYKMANVERISVQPYPQKTNPSVEREIRTRFRGPSFSGQFTRQTSRCTKNKTKLACATCNYTCKICKPLPFRVGEPGYLRFLMQSGPLPVINGVTTPIIKLITQVTHVLGHFMGLVHPFITIGSGPTLYKTTSIYRGNSHNGRLGTPKNPTHLPQGQALPEDSRRGTIPKTFNKT